MAITSSYQLSTAIDRGRTITFYKASQTESAGFWYTLWRTAGNPAPNATLPTTTGTALSRTSVGAVQIPPASNTSYLAAWEGTSAVAGGWAVCDRLIEFGGLSGVTITAQTVSALALPSRATGATDVELWIEIMTAAGATASPTVTCSYTNQSGTAGRTATLIGGFPASGTPVNRTYQMSLQAGDTGVQSVESFTSTTSTTTAGSIGLVLRRVLQVAMVPMVTGRFSLGWADLDLQIIPDDAALEFMSLASTTSSGAYQGNLAIAQG